MKQTGGGKLGDCTKNPKESVKELLDGREKFVQGRKEEVTTRSPAGVTGK